MDFSQYPSTYTPNFQKAQTQGGSGSVLDNPAFAAAAASAGVGSGGPNAPQGQQYQGAQAQYSSGNPLDFNFNPSATKAYADPALQLIGQHVSGHDNGGTFITGQQTNTNSPIYRSTPWQNPLDELQKNAQFGQQYNPDGSPNNNPYMFQSLPGNDKNDLRNSGHSGGVSGIGASNNTGDFLTPFSGFSGQMTPWELSDNIRNMGPGNLSKNTPGQVQQMFSDASQGLANAYANPNYTNVFKGGTSDSNHQVENDWMHSAYNNYVSQMNKYHQF